MAGITTDLVKKSGDPPRRVSGGSPEISARTILLVHTVPPGYWDTETGLILTVQLGSTLCMSYSNGEYAREYVYGKIELLTQTFCSSFNFFIYLQVILRTKLQLRLAQVQVASQEPF